MKKTILVAIAVLGIGLLTNSAARADELVIQAPFVTVRINAGGPGGVMVSKPFVHIRVPPRTMAAPKSPAPPLDMLPPPVPLPPAGDGPSKEILPPATHVEEKQATTRMPPPLAGDKPSKEVLPPATPVEDKAATTRVPTFQELAGAFQATAGVHDVTFLHPLSGQSVEVHFTLPEGAPRRVRIDRHEWRFDYGRSRVEIRFKHDGKVKVEYH